jgi:hypothetical protein
MVEVILEAAGGKSLPSAVTEEKSLMSATVMKVVRMVRIEGRAAPLPWLAPFF